MDHQQYDVVIIGAGVAGSAMAHALATLPGPNPWRIALIERSFSQPDRFVGESLQTGGLCALQELGMGSALDNTGSVPVEGYHLFQGNDSVIISLPKGNEGRSFHHGRFVMGLRRVALQNANVHPIEATATQLIQCPCTGRVIGTAVTDQGSAKLDIYGDLVIVADGCFSMFRQSVLQDVFLKPEVTSYALATVMEDTKTPTPQHAMIVLPDGLGPVYLYQITETDTRILLDIPVPLPKDVKGHILDNIIPHLPESIRDPAAIAFSEGRIRKMPNSFLPPIRQGTDLSKEGIFLLGDSWNMRHPLTGAGMTVALKDVVYLRTAIERSSISSFKDWDALGKVLRQWHWERKSRGAATLNLMSLCTYALVHRDDGAYGTIRRGIVKYFVNAKGHNLQRLIGLLSGMEPSPTVMLKCFCSIGLFSGRLLMTEPEHLSERYRAPVLRGKTPAPYLSVVECFKLFVEAIVMNMTVLALILPCIWSEVRWWSPRRRMP